MNLSYGNHFLRPKKVHNQILVKKYNLGQISLDVEKARPNTNSRVGLYVTF